MPIPPLYHASRTDWGVPRWWFGAPAIAFLYAFLTPEFVPDIVTVPDGLPENLHAPMRWFVGLLGGVAMISTWRLIQWVQSFKRV
jgi:hypothetical protein